MINPRASNWVDRGEPPEPVLGRVLSYYLQLDEAAREKDLDGYVAAVRGMAEADATEVHIAGYLGTIEEHRGITNYTPRDRRAVSIALWHIAKAAEVRDRARRLLEELRPADSAKQVSLSELLAERILSRDPPPEEADS